jgi:hypothetical protein
LHRKRFFEDFAKKKEIDLSVVENWYSVSIKDVLNEKVKPQKREEGRGEN